ncbi:MAG: hypothetical protein Q8S11_07570 [Daejeonella sp.]|uniref:hypothetical protein n=1 Tax=Daejeonella sp. TaxID=2805397 RepID=UPI00273326A1|nr:hypothetical protein [Daejeonella sp.]MDP3468178.1 hypothetical protein [Daejeonella sp.]
MRTLSLLAITALVAASFTANAAGGKIKIRHKGKMIEVSSNALDAHLDHGDVQLFPYKGTFLSQAEINADLAAIEQEFVDTPREDGEIDQEEPAPEDEF